MIAKPEVNASASGPLAVRSVRNLIAGDEGAVTMMFAMCASLMIGSMCTAIDAIHYEMTQARMQMALDVATLSAGADLAHYDTTKSADLAQWKLDARAYYDVNMPSGYMALNLPDANFAANVTGAPATGQTIQLTASGSMPLIAPVIFGNAAAAGSGSGSGSGANGKTPSTSTVSASNTALRMPKSTLELVMVLDNTSSMGDSADSSNPYGDSKIDGLQVAAQNLVQNLFSSATTDSYVGLVPFTTMVNVGSALKSTGKWMSPNFTYNASQVSMTYNQKYAGSGWGGCPVEPRDSTKSLSVQTYDPSKSPGFTPFYYNVPPGGFNVYNYTQQTQTTGSGRNKQTTTTCPISSPVTFSGVPLQIKSGGTATACSTVAASASTPPPAIYDRWYQDSSGSTTYTVDQNYNISYPTSRGTVTINGPCGIAPALFLSKDQSALTKAIQNMVANGNTIIPTGLLWGWRMLSSKWSDNLAGSGNGWISTDTTLPRPETTQALQRVAIVLSDGENSPGASSGLMPNQSFNGISGVGNSTLTAPYVQRLDGTYMKDGSMGTIADINAYQVAICTAMKQDGITIYSITFGDDQSDEAVATMKSCASPGNYYHAPSNTTLNQIFQQIAGNLGVLRLTQ